MLELFGLVSIWQLWTSRRCQIAGCEQHRQIRLYPRQSLMHTSNPLVLYFLSRWWVWGISANVKHHPWHCPTAPRPCWKELQQTSCLFPRDWVVALDPCYPGPGLCGLMPVWQLTYNFFSGLENRFSFQGCHSGTFIPINLLVRPFQILERDSLAATERLQENGFLGANRWNIWYVLLASKSCSVFKIFDLYRFRFQMVMLILNYGIYIHWILPILAADFSMTQPHTYAYTHIALHTYTLTHGHTHRYIRTYPYIHTSIHPSVHHTSMHPSIHASKHPNINASILITGCLTYSIT